jgi:hypothetical protein
VVKRLQLHFGGERPLNNIFLSPISIQQNQTRKVYNQSPQEKHMNIKYMRFAQHALQALVKRQNFHSKNFSEKYSGYSSSNVIYRFTTN